MSESYQSHYSGKNALVKQKLEPQRATTCMEPHRGRTIASSNWNFLRERWLDRKQELITVIQEETKSRSDPDFQT